MPPRLLAALAAFVLVPAGGCGGGGLAPVSGHVTLDGQPLAGALVTFLPVAAAGTADAAGPGAMAVTGPDGAFRLHTLGVDRPGAVPGAHRVRVSTRDADAGDGPAKPERVPARYNRDTTLTFDVPPAGTPAADFDLKSR